MTEYLLTAWAVFLIGFAPMAEIYVAVPAGFALGLDPFSAVFWSVAGNFAPIPLLHAFYEKLRAYPRLDRWLAKLDSDQTRRRVEAGGVWFYLVATPVVGTWAIAVAVKLLRIEARRFLLPTFISVLAFGVLIGLLVSVGVEWGS